ncbi:TPA: hypothetical protein IFD02_002780 [Escherichia coli]|nr:hypothetical protein [Escherichia coli]
MTVFPAPAGINRPLTAAYRSLYGVPRASGDKPDRYGRVLGLVECSPRQRG